MHCVLFSVMMMLRGKPRGSLPENGRRLVFPRKTDLPVYIAPCGEFCRREGDFMSDFELLSIVMMILAIIVTLMVELFRNTRK